MDFFSVLQQDHHLPIIGAKIDVDETNLPKVLDYLVAQILNALITLTGVVAEITMCS